MREKHIRSISMPAFLVRMPNILNHKSSSAFHSVKFGEPGLGLLTQRRRQRRDNKLRVRYAGECGADL